MHVWINCVRSRECGIWRFRGSKFWKIFPGQHATPYPPYIIRAFGADSPLVSPVTLVLNVQFHTRTKRMIIPSLDGNRSLNTKETLQNETTLPLRKSLSQKSSWIVNLEKKFCRNHESAWGKTNRNHEYQDSNDSASTPDPHHCCLNNRGNH